MCSASYWLQLEQVGMPFVTPIAAGFWCRKGIKGGYLTVPGKQAASLFLESDT